MCVIRCCENEEFNGAGREEERIEWDWACGEEEHRIKRVWSRGASKLQERRSSEEEEKRKWVSRPM